MFDDILAQGIFGNATIGIAVSNREGRITESNGAFCQFVGRDKTELLRMTVADLCIDADRERELAERGRLVAGQIGHLSFRKRYPTSSGETAWGDTVLSAVRDAAGGCRAVVAMVIDVTDQRRQQLLLQGQAHVLGKLYRNHTLEEVCTAIVETIEAVEDGLLCSILQLNALTGTLHKIAAPNLSDYYNDAIEGMRIGEGVGSCGTAAFRKERVVVSDILRHPFWAKARKITEKTSLRACWSQPIFGSDGEVLGTFAIYYNEPREPGPSELELITSAAELTALAISHKKAMDVLLKNDQLKSEFISTAAHELRTPITSIMGYADLLLSQTPSTCFSDEQKRSFMSEIIESSEHLKKIIDEILDLSRIESGRGLPLDKQPTSLAELLAKVVNRFNLAATHRFCMEIKPDTPAMIMVDRHRISQVLENLLSNAVKYSPKGSDVTVVAERNRYGCKITVADQGIGMTNEEISNIFDKFYRADSSSTAVSGLGLGMSIVKQIVEDHGGSIRVKSAPGKGCRVSFILPGSESDQRGACPGVAATNR